MGKLVRFKRSKRPIPAHPGESEGGRVLIFTGVRYERQTESDTEKRRRPAGKRKRKRG